MTGALCGTLRAEDATAGEIKEAAPLCAAVLDGHYLQCAGHLQCSREGALRLNRSPAADLHGTADEGRFLCQHRRKGVPADDDRVGKVQYGQVVLDLPGGELGVRQQANDHRADALRVHLRAVANAEEMGRLLVAEMVGKWLVCLSEKKKGKQRATVPSNALGGRQYSAL